MKFTQFLSVAIAAASVAEGRNVRRKTNATHTHGENVHVAIELPSIPDPLPLIVITVNSIELAVNTSQPVGDIVAAQAQALAQKSFSVSKAAAIASPAPSSSTQKSSSSSTKVSTTTTKASSSSTKTSSTTKASSSSTKTSSSTKASSSSTKTSSSSSKTSSSSTKTSSSSSTKASSTSSTKTSSSSSKTSSSSSSTKATSSSATSSKTSSTSSSSSAAASSSASTTASSTTSSSTSSSSSSSSATASASAIANSVSSTILVIARDQPSALEATTGLNAYGIPFEVFTVPQSGAVLPVLNNTATSGNYGGIILLGEVSYDYGGGAYHSALNDSQYATIYTYQTEFGVRLVRIDVYPGSTTGTAVGGSCCTDPQDQTVYFSDVSAFPTAGLIVGATHSTAGLFHYVASITDSTIATPFLKYGASSGTSGTYADGGIGGVINNISGRQQMVFFITFGIAFSPTSNYIQHSFIHWVTRGAYVGFRRVNLNTQIDDMFLSTDIYLPTLPDPGTTSPITTTFRLTTADLDIHKAWTTTINNKLTANNPGSSYFIEIGHNGDGNIIIADNYDENNDPPYCGIGAIYLDQGDDVGGLEYQKVLGTGTSLWPTTPATYPYTTKCLNLDSMKLWFAQPANRDVFAHISHTFTHEAENNATYFDIAHEITWNQAWLTQSGIAAATKFSPHGIIPPAITGLHNGDAIKAWMDNGITNVVGDNSRPVLRNPYNTMYALTTNVSANGYAGLNVSPRWPTNIYYNCDTQNCTHTEWVVYSKGYGTFDDLLTYEKTATTRYLYGLYHDAYMFHQANLRVNDIPYLTTINGVSSKLSIFQAWVETIVQEMVRTVTWPIITIKHDDMGAKFIERESRDKCSPQMTYLINTATQKITGVTVTATGNSCSVQIPVTVPGPVVNQFGATAEQVGNDPLTLWTTLSGSPVTYTLTTPISF